MFINLQDYGIYAFPILLHAGIFTPNAMTSAPGRSMGAAREAGYGAAKRVAHMGDPITTHPTAAGTTNARLAAELKDVYLGLQ